MLIIGIIVICIALSGCAPIMTYFYERNEEGKMVMVGYIEQDKSGLAARESGDKKMSVDSRQISWWEKNVVPIFSGVLDKASRAR